MNNINKSKFINFFVVLAVILLLIFFNWRGLLSSAKDLALWTVSPFVRLFRSVDNGISGAWNFFMTLKNLNKENADLKNANLALVGEMAQLKETARENEALRRQLGVAGSAGRQLVMADVVGYNPALGQYFLINKGGADGLSAGLAVIAADNFLVGRVVEVEEKFSKVLLIFDSNSSISAVTQDTRVSGAVKGSHGLGVFLEMIPIDTRINIGETVLTAGLNDGIPKDLVVGKIADVVKKANDIFQRASLTPAIEIKSLEQVFVLLK